MRDVEKGALVVKRLEEIYGNPSTALKYDTSFQLLVAVILSAQCTDQRVNIVTKELFKYVKEAKDIVNMDMSTLEKYIFSTGFYRSKAKNIKRTAELLSNITFPKKMEDFVKLAGVGRKTANVVLAELYGLAEGVVVDTHIYRVSRRVGLSNKTSREDVERDLMRVLDRNSWIKYGNLVIWHGRDICKSRNPNCSSCYFKDICNYYNKLKK